MSPRNPSTTPHLHTPTPLNYVNPKNPFDPNPSQGPDGNPGNNTRNPPDPSNKPDPGEPDDDPEPSNPPSPPPNDNRDRFLEAIIQLSDSLRHLRWNSAPKSEKIKVRDPDTFDSSNPRKLHDFLVSCNLHFRDRPQIFASDEKKILFILSYLKGLALSWFEPGLDDPTNSAHWMWDYPAFLSELEDNFGPHDPVMMPRKHFMNSL